METSYYSELEPENCSGVAAPEEVVERVIKSQEFAQERSKMVAGRKVERDGRA